MLLTDTSNASSGIDYSKLGMIGLGLLANPNQPLSNALLEAAQTVKPIPQTTQQVSPQNVDYLSSSLQFLRPGAVVPQVPQQPSVQAMPGDKQGMLTMLKAQAQAAYPDNPTMQKVAITQAIHESGLMGKPSGLAMRSNNLFGIKSSKAFPGTAGSVNMATQEVYNGTPQQVNAAFAQNNSVADSFAQHRDLLTRSRRYQPVIAAQDPTQAFAALQGAGYATDPRYANKLNAVYNRYVAPLYQN